MQSMEIISKQLAREKIVMKGISSKAGSPFVYSNTQFHPIKTQSNSTLGLLKMVILNKLYMNRRDDGN